jgi:hypothetical protein
MKMIKRIAFVLVLSLPVSALADAVTAKLYKNPDCYCCELYGQYLEENGYEVDVIATEQLVALKAQHNIPQDLAACHTTVIGDYVVEGHVPVESIDRLLEKQPNITGIGVAGMPSGSPGMPGRKTGPIVVHSFAQGELTEVYESH